jgi:cytoskeletal protein RodZ
MQEIGSLLREARERLGLTLEEVERQTRIRTYWLEALERGEFEALSSPVQARGFLRTYGEFLGLEAGDLLDRWADSALAWKPKPRAAGAAVGGRASRPRWITPDLLVAAAVSLIVLVALVWGGGRVMAAMRERTEAEALTSAFLIPTASSTPLPQTDTPTPTLDTAEAEILPAAVSSETPTLTATFPLAAPDRVDLRLLVEKRAWVLVLVDGREEYRGRVAPGRLLEFQAERQIEVLTSNGAGLRALFEGEDQGLMGELGQIVRRLWSFQGVLTPTPSTTPTPTETPPPSATPAGTSSP